MVTVGLSVSPATDPYDATSCDITWEEEVKGHLSADLREAVENGVQSAYLQGNRVPYESSQYSCPSDSQSVVCVIILCCAMSILSTQQHTVYCL